MHRLPAPLVFVTLLLASSSVQAATLTYQQGDGGPFSDTEDTFLAVDNPGTNYSSMSRLSVDQEDDDYGTEDTHSLVWFPDAFGSASGQVPIGATVTSATLTLRVFDWGDQINAHRALESWVAAQSTWNSRSNGLSWTNPGADSPTSSSGTILDSILSLIHI